MALDAGTRLGPYEILSHLGSGGMGEVYRARGFDNGNATDMGGCSFQVLGLEAGQMETKPMKKFYSFRQTCPLLLLLILTTSCNGQDKAHLQEEGPRQEQSRTDLPRDSKRQPESNLTDVDPWFVESQAIVTSSGPSSITRNILQDRKGSIWLATWEGIIRYDGKSFTNVTNKESLRRFRAFCVLEDRKGNIWFGTIGAGVYRYDGKVFTNFTTKDGLVNDRVGCIYEDKAGNVWFGTDGGASRYDGKSFRNFTTKEGLPNNDINTIVEDNTGKFWFGTSGDTCSYDGKTFITITNTKAHLLEMFVR